ncbi:expressed unknown protein [Seminavis robusta]|uniref:Uncharacterized protein n=1 Tax=Seminavis robusta TaxID=568900 RepID=A0A9N8DM76_9STRA|nr:expressed unknown protein [Seminavis robusta]|eukprot:Sro238_g095530.1 n/a (171) ;mRNA; f:32564-33076
MSFFLRPFQRTLTSSKPSRKSGQRRRASCSDANNVPPSSDTLDASDVFLNEDEDTTLTYDASSSSVDVMISNSSKSRKQEGKTKNDKQQQQHNKKPSNRRASVGSGGRKKRDHRRKTTTSTAMVEQKFLSDLNELAEIEEFVKKMSASSKGEKLLQEHLKSRPSTVGGNA